MGDDDLLFKFGVFADLQYGDFGNRTNYSGSRNRFYRNSLNILKRAVDVWSSDSDNLDFILQMGDLIDGFNSSEFNSTQAAFTDVMSVIREKIPSIPLFHVIGNHELYNFPRNDLHFAFPFPECPSRYDVKTYELRNSRAVCFQPAPKFLVVIVDDYEFSMLGYPENAIYDEAKSFLMTRNPNHHELNSPEGLSDFDIRFCKYNGAISLEQLAWLESILTYADSNAIRVIVAGHQPVDPDACDAACLDWRYDSFLSTIRRHPCVVAYMAGHNHDGGYSLDSAGIHHITFQGVIETPPGSDCFATVNVYANRLEVNGYGRVPSRVCLFKTS